MILTPPQPQLSEALDLSFVDQAVARIGAEPDKVIPILQAIQSHYNYLPQPALRRVCEITPITPATITGVSTFYARFRHHPAGKHIIRVCHGTACHVKGSGLVEDALRRHLNLAEGQDTDAEGQFTLERVGCLGCCTLAPVVQTGPTTYGHQSAEVAYRTLQDYLESRAHQASSTPLATRDRQLISDLEIRVGCGSCCIAGGAAVVRDVLEEAVHQHNLGASVKPVGCIGMCHQTPMVEITRNGKTLHLYAKVTGAEAGQIVRRHFRPRGVAARLKSFFTDSIDRLLADDAPEQRIDRHAIDVRDPPVCSFLSPQKRIATEECGNLDPLDLDEYLRHEGFVASRKALNDLTPDQIIDSVRMSGLRGRGGAGFPTGEKWAKVRASKGEAKYLICNGDEGDPGAFMDRMILESFPYRVIEGMIIAAKAVGATQGILYIREEYPLAVQRIQKAIDLCIERGLLSRVPFVAQVDGVGAMKGTLHLRIVEGAGAFVCGEETALIAAVEGRRGMPQLKPPFPAESGLHGKPTCINNVETYAMIPWIFRRGADAFSSIGTKTSKGTKVFALTGKIRRGGLVEVPMGISLRQIVEEIGGGAPPGRRFKAVQLGGPSGGCVPAEMCDLPVDYESLASVGAIMGSGGMVVLDDTDCMVDIARYFLSFTQAESCGKCTFCRIGTKILLDILTRLCDGKGRPGDLDKLDELCGQVKAGSLCGLGQTAPNPVLTTLKYFRHEYEAHLKGHCPAGRCKNLIKYVVNDTCIGCTKCAQACPAGAIPMVPYQKHEIDVQKCTRCDVCRTTCPEKSIVIV